jgi:phage terminase large subunit
MNEYETYIEAGRAAGCPADQMRLFERAGIVLQPRQLAASAAARLCDRPDGPTAIGYGGARGGGKSHWLLAQMGADDCQRVPGLKCLLLRKVGKANIEHFQDLRRRLFMGLNHDFSAFRGVLTFANGSRIISGHFQCESDIDAYLGLEYDVIGIEEATTLSERKHRDISTCSRTSKILPDGSHWRPRIYSTTNPGGIGHAWYRAKFLAPFLDQRESDTRFVPARVDDNAFNNPEYRKILEGLSGWQRRAWLDGDWDLAAGQFFTTFSRSHHVLDQFDDSRALEWYGALDYGFAHYTVFLLGCRDGDGNACVVDEHAQRLWLPSRHADAIRAMLGRHGLTLQSLSRIVAGADVFSRQCDGTTIAAQYARLGIPLGVANTDRVNGWAEVMAALGDPLAGIPPKLFLHRRCTRLIETLPAMQHDPRRPEDVLKVDADDDDNGGDDTADALRYLIMAMAQPAASMPVPWPRRKR